MFIFNKETVLVKFNKEDIEYQVTKVEAEHPYIKGVFLTSFYFVELHRFKGVLQAVRGTYEECYELLKERI